MNFYYLSEVYTYFLIQFVTYQKCLESDIAADCESYISSNYWNSSTSRYKNVPLVGTKMFY